METKRYSVVLLGITADNDAQAVKQQLAQTFRVAPEKIEQLLSTVPVTVKSGVDYQTALKYLGAIQHAGGICRMDPQQTEYTADSSRRAHGPTLKTCPNCGYCATTSDDSLLTAHDGKGECPACGIIVAKFTRSREAMLMNSSPVEDTVEASGKGPGSFLSAVLSHPWMSLLILVAVVVLGKNLFFSSSGPELVGSHSGKKETLSGNSKLPAKKNPAAGKTVVNRILPGETRNFHLITYLDFFHRDSFSPVSFTPKATIVNKWEDKGLHVEIQNATISPITVSLWEQLRAKEDLWVPAGYRRIVSHGAPSAMVVKGRNLLVTSYAAALVKKPDDVSMKIDPADSNFRKSPYTFYRLEYELSVSVPAGSEFGDRDLTVTTSDGRTVPGREQQTQVGIHTFVSWDLDDNAQALTGSLAGPGAWQATKAASTRTKDVYIDVRHVARTEGVVISPGEKFCDLPGYCELAMQ